VPFGEISQPALFAASLSTY